MPMFRQEELLRHGVKKPSEFLHDDFIKAGVKVHAECIVELARLACFMEPHEGGRPHLDLLVRSTGQSLGTRFARRGDLETAYAQLPSRHQEMQPLLCKIHISAG